MDSKDVIVDALGRIRGLLGMSLDGLTAEQLAYRPSEQANSIAWLAWHLTRVQDDHLSALAGREQAWVAEGWHSRFGKPADPQDTGQGYTPEQVAAIRPDGPQILLDYHEAVHQRSVAYVQTLTPPDLDRVLNEPQYTPLPTVGVRLVSVCSDNLQHAGQIAYLRGLILDKRWFPA
ncbi:MAG TPA: DinB family protein [Chloroflexota bacterium]|nr:DinB family protein [Chloroflexota bacterium]